ncbi:MAG: hypothetical protein NT007_01005 [Candidatus Kapabacteria bacterium]|nr:hypothetical protein [Candidatus Kapabacteria bacterium]
MIFYVFIIVLILSLANGCKDPAPNCNSFCKFKINITQGNLWWVNNGWGPFTTNGGRICSSIGGFWPTFDLSCTYNNQTSKIFSNNGNQLNSSGTTDWINGNCISKADAAKYASSGVLFQITKNTNLFFLVKDGMLCSEPLCALYRISLDEKDIRYTIDNSNCGINFYIKARPNNYMGQGYCKPCSCVN